MAEAHIASAAAATAQITTLFIPHLPQSVCTPLPALLSMRLLYLNRRSGTREACESHYPFPPEKSKSYLS